MEELIGNTPMVRIDYEYKGNFRSVYVKLEQYNLTGSIKDRVAYYMIVKAKEKGILKDGMPIIEATSGNTGISLAALGVYYNHPVYIFMPDWVSSERLKLMKLYGANVTLFSKEDGGFKRCIQEASKLTKKINGYYIDQFSNTNNILAHYETTGKEIIDQLSNIGGFVTGIGTGGTLMGIGKRIKETYPDAKICALEPEKMSLIKKVSVGSHKIDGIGDEFIPELVDLDFIEDIVLINDEDAINMARKLSKYLGIGTGISSGANLIAAIILNESIEGNMVTVFADDSKKYLSSDLSKEIDENELFISNQINLITYQVINK
jgi:cysteine synthase A